MVLMNYRTVLGYYSSPYGDADEDAYDMRKVTSWDPDKTSLVNKHPVITSDELH